MMAAQHSRFTWFCLFAFTVIVFGVAGVQSVQAREMADFPIVKLQSLDKVTARTMTFEARVGSTVKFGQIFIKVQACRKSKPIDQPESAAFLQVWEVTPKDEAEWIFSGWMFASSPGLSSMDHPIYDVWVIDCQDSQQNAAAEIESEELSAEEKSEAPPPKPAEKLE